MRRSRASSWLALAVLTVTGQAVAARQAGGTPQPPTGHQQAPPVFRGAVTLIPIDVRVTDKSGKPVTDLRPEEFTIVEDGVRQDIRHFSVRTLSAAPPAADTPLVLRDSAVGLAPQANRIFLFVLGRGKLQEPSKAIDAAIRFVGEQLLPQDQVAVFAYNRATAFTRDHQSVAALLRRFAVAHEQVDFEIGLQMSGLAAVYGSKAIPRSLQGKIDAIFTDSGPLASRRVEAGDAAASRVEGDARRQVDAQMQKEREVAKAEASAAAGVAFPTMWSASDEIETQMFADLPLETFVETTAQTLQDLGNLYAGIEYLRHFEGEKHIIYLTERGLLLPRGEEDEILAAAANDARVSIDTVQTGGVYVGQTGGGVEAGRTNMAFAFQTLKAVAEMTGGVSSVAQRGASAMDRIDAATRGGYLLGYYPKNVTWDDRYRKVTVKVSRPDVNLYYRRGYYSRRELPAFSRREYVSADRIRAAAVFSREIKDIRLDVKASFGRASEGPGYEIAVQVNIDPSKLAFTFIENIHVGQVSIAVFCRDQQGNEVGHSLQTADLQLKEEIYRKVLASGIPYRVRLSVRPEARSIRVVVYDFKADLIGSADKYVQ